MRLLGEQATIGMDMALREDAGTKNQAEQERVRTGFKLALDSIDVDMTAKLQGHIS